MCRCDEEVIYISTTCCHVTRNQFYERFFQTPSSVVSNPTFSDAPLLLRVATQRRSTSKATRAIWRAICCRTRCPISRRCARQRLFVRCTRRSRVALLFVSVRDFVCLFVFANDFAFCCLLFASEISAAAAQCDIFSLGISIYELAAGKPLPSQVRVEHDRRLSVCVALIFSVSDIVGRLLSVDLVCSII